MAIPALYTAQNSFTSGEWSPELAGRTDLKQFDHACKRMKNFVTSPRGGARTRPPLRFAAVTKFKDTYASVLIPFEFNVEQAYQIETGRLYMRFHAPEVGRVETGSGAVTGAANNGSGLVRVTKAGHGWSNGDYVAVRNVKGTREANGDWQISGVTANTFDLVGSTFTNAYTSGGTAAKIYELTTTYTESQVADLQYTQSSDTMYIFHEGVATRKLTRLTASSFSIDDVEWTDGPFLPDNTTATTITVSSWQHTITNCADNGSGLVRVTCADHRFITGDSVTVASVVGTTEANGTWTVTVINSSTFDLQGTVFVNPYVSGGTAEYATTNAVNHYVTMTASAALFESGHVNGLWKFAGLSGGYQGNLRITDYVSTTVVRAKIKRALSALTATASWAEGAWSTKRGFPRCGLFYDNRLYVGGTTYQPGTFWGSKTGEFENFDMQDDTAEYAFSWDLLSRQANRLQWIAGDNALFMGTAGREYHVKGGTETGVTPTSVSVPPATRAGCADVMPAETTSGMVFVQRSLNKLRLMSYKLELDSFTIPDLSLLANHLFDPQVKDADDVSGSHLVCIAYQQEPYEIIWAVAEDGRLMGVTLLEDQNVRAWHQHDSGTDGSACQFKWASTSPVSTGHQAWFITRRNVNGVWTRYVEYMDDDMTEPFLDCAVTSTLSPASASITTGLEHLEGESVCIVADGARYPNQTVTNGGLPTALDTTVSTITVGLEIDNNLTPFLPDRDLPDGPTTGRHLKINKVLMKVNQTIGLKVNGQPLPVRDVNDYMDTGPVAHSEEVSIEPELDWDQEPEITQPEPFAAHILALAMHVEIGDLK